MYRRMAALRQRWTAAGACIVTVAIFGLWGAPAEARTCLLVAEETTHLNCIEQVRVLPGNHARIDSRKRLPRIRFMQTSVDLGTVYQDERPSCEFIFRNVGDSDLRVLDVDSSCGCTAAAPENRVIPPGEESRIHVTLNPSTLRGRIGKHIWVQTDDSEQPRIELTLTASIVVEIECSARGFYLGRMSTGQALQRSLIVRSVSVATFSITAAISDDPDVQILFVKRIAAPKGTTAYEVMIRVGPAETTRRISSSIALRTDLPHTKEVRISIYARVVNDRACGLHVRPVANV